MQATTSARSSFLKFFVLAFICLTLALPAFAQNSYPATGNLVMGAGANITLRDNQAVVWGAGAGGTEFQIGNGVEHSLTWYTNYSPRMRVDGNGRVGINTMSPTATLDVQGDVVVSGNIAAKYQDVAEWVPVTTPVVAGTVVVLNPEKVNEVMPASKAYDTGVAGVVSQQPGLILGEKAANKAQIATFGRVRVKAIAGEKPIAIGDLLVTSNRQGVAMRSEPMQIGGRAFHQPGTIIGKALEPLPSGEGEILVLLSLQ